MSASPSDNKSEGKLARERDRYVYRPQKENQLAPISTAKSWPWLREQYGPSWLIPFVPGLIASWLHVQVSKLRFLLQRLTFRFDKDRAYLQLLGRKRPDYVEPPPSDPDGDPIWMDDAGFAHWRVGGANPLLLRQQRDLDELRQRIPLDVERIEGWLRERVHHEVSLAEEAARGTLFVVDFELLFEAQRPEPATGRDTEWRARHSHASRFGFKYLPTPIGVFLELPGFYGEKDFDLVPLAIQIDKVPNDEENRVYYPDERWPWRMAKMYFEVADTNYHDICGHVFRTHYTVQPFGMATPRQLPEDHPVYVLLYPHLRFTLATNKAAYEYFTNRTKSYQLVYAGSLQVTREIAIQGYKTYSFREMQFEADLSERGVRKAPGRYPYREDAQLWMDAIREFVRVYLRPPEDGSDPRYRDDQSVQDDHHLQEWARELMDPDCGALRDMVPDGRLDTLEKLENLLTQVIFTAGPEHASQHFATNYYYRYAPAFAAAAYRPPARDMDEMHYARWISSLPPVAVAAAQFHYNTFSDFQYDTFGHYGRYPLGRAKRAEKAIKLLQASLLELEGTIMERNVKRPLPYEFLLPSRVPNSINI